MEPITLTKYFKKATRGPYSKYHDDAEVYIFDVDYNRDYPGSATIGFVGHGYGCGHLYSYFLDRALEGAGTSYIYKPIIPEDKLAQKIDEEYTILVKKYNYTYYDITTEENVVIVD